jgi:hypothetical protein
MTNRNLKGMTNIQKSLDYAEASNEKEFQAAITCILELNGLIQAKKIRMAPDHAKVVSDQLLSISRCLITSHSATVKALQIAKGRIRHLEYVQGVYRQMRVLGLIEPAA